MAYNTGVNTKNDLIIESVQRELEAKATITTRVTDLSRLAGPGVKEIQIPKLDSFTAVDRAFGVAGSVSELTDSVDSIALDQNVYVSWGMDRSSQFQSSINYEIELAKRAASAHSRFVNNLIVTRMIAAAGYVEGVAVVVTKSIMLNMYKTVLGFEGQVENMNWECHIDQYTALLAISDFVDADKIGRGVLPSGAIGMLMGIPVIINNFVPNDQFLLHDKDGFGYALQQAPNLGEQPDIAFGSKGVKKALDQVMGCGHLQDNVKAVGAGNSPLIAVMK